MVETDKETNTALSKKPSQYRKANTAQLTYHCNMARMTVELASEEFQDSSSPILFHRFDDIPVPHAAPALLNFEISKGFILKILRKQGLLEGGANGGISNGKDMCLMYFHPDGHHVNISRVGNHQTNDCQLATFFTVIEADLNGIIYLVLGIFHNYAYVPEQVGTIHSNIQLRTYGNLVCDCTVKNGGQSCVVTPDGYTIPVRFRGGLPYIKHHFPTDEQVINLLQVVMTANSTWDPTCQDTDHPFTQELMAQILTTPVVKTDAFYNQEEDVADTGSYLSSQAFSQISHTNNGLGQVGTRDPDPTQASSKPVSTQN